MNFNYWPFRWFLIVTLALAICAGALAAQPANTGSGRLVVQRSPKFGSLMVLQLWIDGHKAGTVRQGNRYDHPISAGHHTIAANYAPKTQHQPTSVSLNVRPGQTYVFVATRDETEGVVLQRSKR